MSFMEDKKFISFFSIFTLILGIGLMVNLYKL